ncbi:tyrosine-type recombinase/integrase [Tropicimonas sp. TH_r6]|uniref:tyrosine-type recombinase/integrase n=1 Tax=Tropicimonas sp. TH_r6 TaxID=3082085 RepID=UPI0029549852|nr:tyrosine-type recombinase/integrase [Tropicimonas sp. TH_r6]MDV7145969.1 tyrosine-type recombinase/integrase [Tropicimonas sp. TH_r6]
MSKTALPKGIHRVKKATAAGVVRYHYVCRGGPKFWDSNSQVVEGSLAYLAAYRQANTSAAEAARTHRANEMLTPDAMDEYRRSIHYRKLNARTKADYEKYMTNFEAEFAEDPIKLFEEEESLAEIIAWQNQWAHSPRMYDYSTQVIRRFLNRMRKSGVIKRHFFHDIEAVYRVNRAHLCWKPEEIAAVLKVATPAEMRIVVAMSEGGLAPADVGRLNRGHIEKTPKARRLLLDRGKSGQPTAIAATPAIEDLIDTMDDDQWLIVPALSGGRLTPERAAQIVRDLIHRANADGVIRVRPELRPYDMRGTAATALLRAGCGLNEIAVAMGWSIRHASKMIEHYARLIPEVTDEILEKLERAKASANVFDGDDKDV